MRRSVVFWLMVLFVTAGTVPAGQQFGPSTGSLVVAGGAVRDPAILATFFDLAGGVDKPIVVIPPAGGGDTYDQSWEGLAMFAGYGATDLSVLHTTDPAVADTDAFTRPLREARGVWFSGGRQWRLVDAYLHTAVHREIQALLDRGGVVGGSSAGATILGDYLVRGDTETNVIMMGDHEEGMAFLRGVAIDQHVLQRNRHFDLIEVIRARPDLLGIGLDENTAIIVKGDSFEVIGQSYAVIYDHQRMLDSGGLFYFLAPGDTYDLVSRQVTRPGAMVNPGGRVVVRPWPEAPSDASVPR